VEEEDASEGLRAAGTWQRQEDVLRRMNQQRNDILVSVVCACVGVRVRPCACACMVCACATPSLALSAVCRTEGGRDGGRERERERRVGQW